MRQIFKLLIIGFVIGLAAVGQGFAQDDPPERWYLRAEIPAERGNPAAIELYTVGGAVVEIDSLANTRSITNVYRVRDDLLLVFIEAEEGEPVSDWYRVTPQGWQAVGVTAAIDAGSEVPMRPLAFRDPYVVLQQLRLDPNGMNTVAVNVDTLTVNRLDYPVGILSPTCCRLDADAPLLRYLSNEEGTDGTFDERLVEQNLETGEVRILYENLAAAQTSIYQPNSEGTRWLRRSFDREAGTINFDWIDSDGVITPLDAYERSDPEQFLYTYVDDVLVRVQPLCESDCVLGIDNDGTWVEYALPDDNWFVARIYPLPEADSFVALMEQAFQRITPEEGVVPITEFNPALILNEQFDRLGRSVVVFDPATADDPEVAFALLDMVRDSVVYTGMLERPLISQVFPAGHVVSDARFEETLIYLHADGQAFTLPDSGGTVIDILPDGRVLYRLFGEQGYRDQSIRVYDPATGEVQIVATGYEPYPSRELW